MNKELEKEGTSYAPLILGVIASVLNIPAVICTTACGGFISVIENLAGDESNNIGAGIILVGFISLYFGLSGALNSKKNPIEGGVSLIIAAFLSIIQLFLMFNLLQFFVIVLFVIAALLSFTQKRVQKTPNDKGVSNIKIEINNNISDVVELSKGSDNYGNKNPDYFKKNGGTFTPAKGNPYK